jgi:hypothetical protein
MTRFLDSACLFRVEEYLFGFYSMPDESDEDLLAPNREKVIESKALKALNAKANRKT